MLKSIFSNSSRLSTSSRRPEDVKMPTLALYTERGRCWGYPWDWKLFFSLFCMANSFVWKTPSSRFGVVDLKVPIVYTILVKIIWIRHETMHEHACASKHSDIPRFESGGKFAQIGCVYHSSTPFCFTLSCYLQPFSNTNDSEADGHKKHKMKPEFMTEDRIQSCVRV